MRFERRQRRPVSGRRGYILVAVIGIAVLVTGLGLAFFEANSTAMPEASNRLYATRAQYLAESGVQLGIHFLMYPPAGTPGEYWTGGTGIVIDDTSDFTDVMVAAVAGDPERFTVTAGGLAHDHDGQVRGRQVVQADVYVPYGRHWRIPYAVTGSPTTVPARVAIYGDIHSNSLLTGLGWCQGNVSAVGTALWTGSGPPASVTSLADPFTTPAINAALYLNYNVNGADYAAYSYAKNQLSQSDADLLNAVDMSATNPGRIVAPPVGNFTIQDAARLTGSLVVRGDLEIGGSNIEITAAPGFPALVVTGDIRFTANGADARIDGSVLCGGGLSDGLRPGISFRTVGAFIMNGEFNILALDGDYRFTWDQSRARFWNFENTADRKPVTLLSWKEND